MIAAILLSVAGEYASRNRSVSVTQENEWKVTLPAGFTASRDKDAEEGGETISLYNIKGSRSTASVTGYLREAYLTVSLDKYLEDASEYKSAAIYDFSQSTVRAGGRSGYEWRYKIKKEDGSAASVRTAFFAGNNKFYTVLFSAPAEKESVLDQAFESTLNSLAFADSVQTGKTAGWYNFRSQAFSRCTPLFRAERAGDKICRCAPAEAVHADPFRF